MSRKNRGGYYLFGLLLLLIFPKTVSQAAIAPPPKYLDDLSGLFEVPAIAGNSANETNGLVTVTPDASNRVGAIWSTEANKMDFREDFHMVAHLNLGDAGKNSADGMAFVIQADSPQKRWFTQSGASIGVLADKDPGVSVSSSAILNSVAIEFDLYGNTSSGDGYFDEGISSAATSNQHIATVWPGDSSMYKDTNNWVTKKRVLNHENVEMKLLANGRWIRLELDWDVSRQEFSYSIDEGPKRIINSARLAKNVLSVSDTAYWGFTGSTGPTYRARQQVVFERVPGLVSPESHIELMDVRTKTPIEQGSTVNLNQEVAVSHSYSYEAGKQPWKNIESQLTIGTGFTVTSTEIEVVAFQGEQELSRETLPKEVIQNGTIYLPQGNYSTLSLDGAHPSRVEINYQGKLNQEAFALEDYVLTGTHFGGNAMTSSEFNLQVGKAAPEIGITTENQTVISDREEPFIFTGTWSDPIDSAVTLTAYIDGELVEYLSVDHETWQLTAPENLSYGGHELTVRIENEYGSSSQETIQFDKIGLPLIHESQLLAASVVTGTPIEVSFVWDDFNSIAADVYVRNQDQEFEKIQTVTNHQVGQKQTDRFQFPTVNRLPGQYDVTFKLQDEEGNWSNQQTLSYEVEGTVGFTAIPAAMAIEQLPLNQSEPYKIESLGKVGVVDTRLGNKEWKLHVRLSQLQGEQNIGANFMNEAGQEAPDNFFSYRNVAGKVKNINRDGAIIFEHQTTQNEEVVLDQTGSAGFYLTVEPWMYRGNYSARIDWQIQLAP